MKPSAGSIPEEIAVITGNTEKVQVGCQWDLDRYWWNNQNNDSALEVLPAFVTDASSEKSISTGKIWAGRNNATVKVDVKKNTPIKNVQVCSLDQRGNGGRAYKVIADGVYVDCREDVIIDTMLQEGISKGGILSGEYIWVRLNTQMRLIRVNSTIHQKLKLMCSRKLLDNIENKDLIPGTVYANKKDKRFLFLGMINSTGYEFSRKPQEEDIYKSVKIKNQCLTIEVPEAHEKNIINFIRERLVKQEDNFYDGGLYNYMHYKKDFSLVEEIEKIDIGNLFNDIKEESKNRIKTACLNFSSKKKIGYWEYQKSNLHMDIMRYAPYANMYEISASPVPIFDFETLLTFI